MSQDKTPSGLPILSENTTLRMRMSFFLLIAGAIVFVTVFYMEQRELVKSVAEIRQDVQAIKTYLFQPGTKTAYINKPIGDIP